MCKSNQIKCKGELNLAGTIIPCYVLEDGTRVLSSRGMQMGLKIAENERTGTKINKFLASDKLMPFIINNLGCAHFEPLECYDGSKRISGYKADTLADICDLMLEARKVVHLSPRQRIVADQCEILMRSFARVGITALVDEATGYQAERDNTELQKILAAYISDEVAKWQLTFSSEFYRELYRIYNISETNGRGKPLRVGLLTNKLVYEKLPNGVLQALKEKTGKTSEGNWKHKLHQSLTEDIGRQHLKNQIIEVTTLMSVSDTKEQFKQLFNRMYNVEEVREAI